MTKYTFEDGYVEVVAQDDNTRAMLRRAIKFDLEVEILDLLKSGPFEVVDLSEKLDVELLELVKTLQSLEGKCKVKIRQQMVAAC